MKEGEEVEQFQNLADVATDKLFTQIPAVENGRIHKLHIKEGEPCQVGSILLELEVDDGTPDAVASPAKAQAPASASKGATSTATTSSVVTSQTRTEGGKALSTPAVRDYAKSKNVDIGAVRVG